MSTLDIWGSIGVFLLVLWMLSFLDWRNEPKKSYKFHAFDDKITIIFRGYSEQEVRWILNDALTNAIKELEKLEDKC